MEKIVEINLEEPPSKWKKTIVFLVIGGLLVEFFIFKGFFEKKIEQNNLTLESQPFSLAVVQNNSILPYSNPTEPYRPVKKLKMIITAYSSTPWETDSDPFITASGKFVKEGIVANNLLPFGTKIRIPELYGNKIFVVEDRMHWSKSPYHLDIWFPNYWQAKSFGKKATYVEILEN